MSTKACEQCGRVLYKRGAAWRFCSRKCHGRWLADHPHPAFPRGARTDFRGTLEERLDKYTLRSEHGCWLWTGHVMASGYGKIGLPMVNGRFPLGQKETVAHRAMYERYVGPIPDGLVLDHLCRNRRCVRPDHLEPVTRNENIERGRCERGHLWKRIYGLSGGCRECAAAA